MKVVEDYVRENSGNRPQHYSTKSGYHDLKNRCKRDDLVKMETDKTKKLSIMTKENYISVTAPHTDSDLTFTSDELKD